MLGTLYELLQPSAWCTVFDCKGCANTGRPTFHLPSRDLSCNNLSLTKFSFEGEVDTTVVFEHIVIAAGVIQAEGSFVPMQLDLLLRAGWSLLLTLMLAS